MCPQLPRLSPEYSHKVGLQTVITGMPLQIRPVTRGGHAGPVTMGRNARGPLSWTRPHCGMTSSPVFVWCRSSEGCPCLFCPSDQRFSAKTSSEGWRLCLRPNTQPLQSDLSPLAVQPQPAKPLPQPSPGPWETRSNLEYEHPAIFLTVEGENFRGSQQ
jgi:hypothetical protein